MVKLAILLFLLFSTVSPKPHLLLNISNTRMDMEANTSISQVVEVFKSNSSFSAKLNSHLLIEPKLQISEEPLPLVSETEPAMPMMDTTTRGNTRDTKKKGPDPYYVFFYVYVSGLYFSFLMFAWCAACCFNEGDLPNQSNEKIFKEDRLQRDCK